MELSMLTIEAFAHYMRGAVTLFFIIWCFKLYVYKRRNRMMKLLYYATLFLAFGFLKDAVFLFSDWKNSMFAQRCAPRHRVEQDLSLRLFQQLAQHHILRLYQSLLSQG